MAATRSREPRKRGTSDLLPRILVAIPAVAFAGAIIYFGDWIFAGGLALLAIVCVHELTVMFARARPVRLAAMLAVLGLTVAGTIGDERQVLLALVASVPVVFLLAVAAPVRERITASIAVTMLIIVWIGLGVAHAVMLRGLDHGGALVLLVLLGTFFGDTFAYFGGRLFGGRLFGDRKLAPRISPNKTYEGLLSGIVVGTLIVWYWSRTGYDWLDGTDALLLGLAVVIAAPIGDLFESLIKRDMGTKDIGHAVRRPRRRARPRGRRAVRARRRLLRVARRGMSKDEEEKRDRQMVELLNELRVALPGVQILFAFLLTVPFAQGFTRVTDTQRTLFYARLLATAISTICLIAPSATHRLRFHQSDRAYVIETANKYTIAGLVFLGLAIVLAIATVTDFIYDSWIVWAAPAAVAGAPRRLLVHPPAAARGVLRPLKGTVPVVSRGDSALTKSA